MRRDFDEMYDISIIFLNDSYDFRHSDVNVLLL